MVGFRVDCACGAVQDFQAKTLRRGEFLAKFSGWRLGSQRAGGVDECPMCLPKRQDLQPDIDIRIE